MAVVPGEQRKRVGTGERSVHLRSTIGALTAADEERDSGSPHARAGGVMMRRPRQGAPLGELVGKALAPAVGQHGFATSELIARWEDIVGARFARVTRPLRVVWPRVTAELVDRSGRPPATLVVRCESAHALDLQHAAPLILERVNVLYWAGARSSACRSARAGRRRGAAAAPARAPARDPRSCARRSRASRTRGLRSALERLGRAVESERRVTKA